MRQLILSCLAVGLVWIASAAENQAKAARVHLIAVGDTSDKEIGKFVESDVFSLSYQMEDLGKKSQMPPTILTGENCRPDKIYAELDKLSLQRDDAVVFYFGGHGAYDKRNGQFIQIPRLGKEGNVSREEIKNRINGWVEARQIRLGVLITDMCNLRKIIELPPMTQAPAAVAGQAQPIVEDSPIYKALFVDSEGFVDVSSASTDEAAALYPLVTYKGNKEVFSPGSIFSSVFTDALSANKYNRFSWATLLRSYVSPKVRNEFRTNYPEGIELPDGVTMQQTQTVMINSLAVLTRGGEFRGASNRFAGNGFRLDSIGVTVSPQLVGMHTGDKFRNGVKIVSIDPEAPINASWQPGDVIFSINGWETASIRQLQFAVANAGGQPFGAWWKASIGQIVRRQPIVMQGNGGNIPVRPANFIVKNNSPIRLGVTLDTQIYTVQTPNGPVNGVRVASVIPGTPADNRMLDPGDIILTINDTPTPTVEAFQQAVIDAGDVVQVWGFNSATGEVETFRPIPLR